MPYFPARLDFLSPAVSAPGSPRMAYGRNVIRLIMILIIVFLPEFNSDFEESLRDALKQEDFTKINKKITAKALTQCKKNCLFMSMEVSLSI